MQTLKGRIMTNNTYKYTPNAEQMRYDLVDHHLHMLALFELLSMARSNLNKDYRFKSDDEIKSEWLLTFGYEE